LLFLSGLTCNEENFITKSTAIKYAAKHKIALLCPDTSPRNVNCLGDKEDWFFGEGAAYYLDSTTPEYSKHYRMFSYVTKELLDLVGREFQSLDISRCSVSGHSVGGHGALITAMKTNRFKSVSAFAPVCHPSVSPWGTNAFSKFLGDDLEVWKQWDALELLKTAPHFPLLIDQVSFNHLVHSRAIQIGFIKMKSSSLLMNLCKLQRNESSPLLSI
jgi:S-formylglutathione hydrolase